QSSFYFLRHELRDASLQSRDLYHETRGDGLMGWIGHQEHRFDGGIELLVHAHHGEFVLEVGYRPKTSNDDLRPYALSECHEQCVKRLDDDFRVAVYFCTLLPDHGHALVEAEKRPLF